MFQEHAASSTCSNRAICHREREDADRARRREDKERRRLEKEERRLEKEERRIEREREEREQLAPDFDRGVTAGRGGRSQTLLASLRVHDAASLGIFLRGARGWYTD